MYIPILTLEDLKKRPVSYSSLKAFRKSPKHYIEYITKPREEKEEFTIGNATECLVFEPEKFKDKFEVFTKFERRSNDAKATWAGMVQDAKANKKTLISDETHRLALILAESVKENELCQPYLNSVTKIQKKLEWTDKKTEIPIIGYVDAECEIEEHLIICDFKTTANAEPDKWFKQAAELEYDLQVGAYLTGYHKTAYKFPEFVFIVVEKETPYNSVVIHCPSDYCEAAKDEFEKTLTAFRYCLDEKLWYQGYEFWNAEMPYFTMSKPKWKQSKFIK
jgi:hypothetical protein